MKNNLHSQLTQLAFDCVFNRHFFSKKTASAGNRTRASRVAGENCTTQPPTLVDDVKYNNHILRTKRIYKST